MSVLSTFEIREQLVIFGESEISKQQMNKTLPKIMELFVDYEFLPNQQQEINLITGAVSKKIAFSNEKGLCVSLGGDRVDITRLRTQLDEENSFDVHCDLMKLAYQSSKELWVNHNINIKRLALIKEFFCEFTKEDMERIFRRLYSLFKDSNSAEWTYKFLEKIRINNVNFNQLISISREQGEISSGEKNDPFDKIKVFIEINSDKNEKSPFSHEELNDWFSHIYDEYKKTLIKLGSTLADEN